MISVFVTEISQVADARRQSASFSQTIGLDEDTAARIALTVTELATNLVKHGHGGQIILAMGNERGVNEVLIWSLDKGPGMANVHQCLQDGYSTAGSAGTGLGAVMRQAHAFDIYSQVGAGTAITVSIRPGHVTRSIGPNSNAAESHWGVVSLPKPGESSNGDGYCVAESADFPTILVTDGLGHGIDAATASVAAIRNFSQGSARPLTQLLMSMHDALRPTRGAAIAVARLDLARNSLLFAGIGNIAAAIVAGDKSRKAVSMNGTAGHQLRRVQEFEYPLPTPSILVMHSDGLATSWTLDRYPGIQARSPALIAGVLYRDFGRGRDDVTVLVWKRA